MKKAKTISITFDEYESIDEMTAIEQKLMKAATTACSQAYAPYSEFKVGAAVLLDNGEIVIGNNQENAAYPSGLCAERVAIFAASANYPHSKIKAIALTAQSDKIPILSPISPCGACRQAIKEYEDKAKNGIKIIMFAENTGIQVIHSIEDLLPLSFGAEELNK